MASKLRVVVAAVIEDDRGRFLLTRRRPGSHLEGLWEFPGGAMEEGETPVEALLRELREELGVAAAVGEPLTFAWHRDGVRDVLLLFYTARIQEGQPCGREGQEVRWVERGELATLPAPPADQPLLLALAGTPPQG